MERLLKNFKDLKKKTFFKKKQTICSVFLIRMEKQKLERKTLCE
jgi:hypothetical protein